MYMFRTQGFIFKKTAVISAGGGNMYVYMYATSWYIRVQFCWNYNKRPFIV